MVKLNVGLLILKHLTIYRQHNHQINNLPHYLKSKSRGEDKTGKRLKGKNWELYESPRTQEENLEIFSHVKALFHLENPKLTPYTSTFQTVSKRTV